MLLRNFYIDTSRLIYLPATREPRPPLLLNLYEARRLAGGEQEGLFSPATPTLPGFTHPANQPSLPAPHVSLR
ncbi:hypothetical protein E2C01_001916 [Portunus trituberculatus]|uniref:Uncharacterized protein n=1 Tax=Portunus trituberculatus TaxID=210409 RepID=A0A5B7CIH6_PORTR|nr:hypothetical protein [Portunus trituberculatus]